MSLYPPEKTEDEAMYDAFSILLKLVIATGVIFVIGLICYFSLHFTGVI